MIASVSSTAETKLEVNVTPRARDNHSPQIFMRPPLLRSILRPADNKPTFLRQSRPVLEDMQNMKTHTNCASNLYFKFASGQPA